VEWSIDYYPGVNFLKVARTQLLHEMEVLQVGWVEIEDKTNTVASLRYWLNVQILDASASSSSSARARC
jgi:hypothetical protein